MAVRHAAIVPRGSRGRNRIHAKEYAGFGELAGVPRLPPSAWYPATPAPASSRATFISTSLRARRIPLPVMHGQDPCVDETSREVACDL